MENSLEKEIQFEYKRTTLKGYLKYSEKDMVCCLEIPGGYLHGGSHIPYFAPYGWTEEKAEERAKQKLMDLWDFYNLVLEHKDEILNALPDYFDQKAQAKREYDAVEQKIKDLKTSLRAGTITNKDYQKALTPLKKKRDEISFSAGWYFDHLMKHILKEEKVSYDEHDILTILEIYEKQ
jgi:hypothetical protein